MATIINVIESIAAAVEALLNALGLATPDFVKEMLSNAKDKIREEIAAEE